MCVFDFLKVTRMRLFQTFIKQQLYKYVHMLCNKLFR